MQGLHILGVLALSQSLLSCGGATPATPTHPPATHWLLVPGESVVETTVPCEAQERPLCDAVDNDCNGEIDEGCRTSRSEPFQADPSQIQIAATWSTGADLDLVVTTQDGTALRRETNSASSHTGEGDCGSPQDRSLSRLERLSIPVDGGQALQLRVHSARSCDEEESSVATVSVRIPGGSGAVYNVPVSADGTAIRVADLVPQATPAASSTAADE